MNFETWCEGVPGLRKSPDGVWGTANQTQVSFPSEGHAELVEIENHSYWFKHRNQCIVSVVTLFPPSGPILDVGGGNGYVSMGLAAAGFPAIVVEPGPIAVRTCMTRGVPVIQAAFQDFRFPEHSVDAIGMFDVLEHIEDDEGTLSRIHRALKTGGMLYLAVPAYMWLWAREDVIAGHFRRYSAAILARKLTQAGFQIEFGTYMFMVLVAPLFLLRTVPSRLGLGKVSNEHTLPSNPAGRAIGRALAVEANRIRQGGSVPVGTSYLVAARTRA